jgi:hypothetical protein
MQRHRLSGHAQAWRHADKTLLGGCKQARRTILAFSSTLMPPSPPASLGCRHSTLAQKRSASLSLKPISALGCRPKAKGVSGGMASSMYSNTCSQDTKVCLGNSLPLLAMSCSPPRQKGAKCSQLQLIHSVMICCGLYISRPPTMQSKWVALIQCCNVTPSK